MIRAQMFFMFAACGLLVCGCGSDSGQGALRKGLAALEEENYPEAIACLTRASQRISGSADLYYHLGCAYLRDGKTEPAAAAFLAAIELKPQHGEALAGLGQIAYYTNNLPQAGLYFRQALAAEVSSDDARAGILNGLALTEAGLKRNDMARLYLLRAQQASRLYAPSLFNLANLYRTAYGLREEALDQFEMYVRIAGKDDPYRKKAQDNITQLRANVERTKAEELRALRRDPETAERRLDEGVVAQSKKQFAKAIQCYRDALDADPLAGSAAFGLGVLYRRLNQPAEALAAFKRASSIKPADQDYYVQAAELAIQLKRYDEAERILDRAIARSPYSLASAYLMANIRHAQNRLIEARAYGEFRLSLLRADDPGRDAYEQWVRALPEK